MAKRMDWKAYVMLGAIIAVALGFLYGTGILGGATSSVGSKDDPLVGESWADSTINQKMQDMDVRINSLEAKIQSLESEITILTGGSVITPPTGGTGGTGTGTGTAGGAGGNTGTGTATSPADNPEASAANIGKKGNVTSEVVNLRESGSTESNIKRQLTPSDTFTITKVDKDWYQVQLEDGTIGWVAARLVKIR